MADIFQRLRRFSSEAQRSAAPAPRSTLPGAGLTRPALSASSVDRMVLAEDYSAITTSQEADAFLLAAYERFHELERKAHTEGGIEGNDRLVNSRLEEMFHPRSTADLASFYPDFPTAKRTDASVRSMLANSRPPMPVSGPVVRLPSPPQFRSAFDRPAATPAPAPMRVGGLRIDAPEPRRQRVVYTDEQQAIISANGRVIVGRAKAGTGKTTTAVGYAEARPQQRMLYLSFAKANQVEAETRFPRNTTARTAHSLAFDAVGRKFDGRIDREWRAMSVRQELNLRNYRAAAMTQQVLRNFFNSHAAHIDEDHAAGLDQTYRAYGREIDDALQSARTLWRRMCDMNDRVRIPDDAYLKMWALQRPQLPYDVLIFDEYQDANPVMAQIVANQQQARVLYLGDPHQAIYGFRGARDALETLPADATVFNLTQTWRFGPRIAAIANTLLRELKGEHIPIQGMAADGALSPGATITTLARTNSQLFKIAAQDRGAGVHWVGGIKKYHVRSLLDGYALFINNLSEIKDPLLRRFGSWQEMKDYAEATRDGQLRIMAELVDQYKGDTPHLVEDLERNEVRVQADASLILATAHGVKGLDFDHVQIAPDFEYLAEAEAELAQDPNAQIQEQEINLLYVAFTRARKTLTLNEDTRRWLKDLPKHRENRERARQQHEARQSRVTFAVPP